MSTLPLDRALLPHLASPAPLRHTLRVTGRRVHAEQSGTLAWTLTLPTPETWTLTFDETTRPYGRATLTYKLNAYNWATLDPANHRTLTRLRLETGYTWPTLGHTSTAQLATLILVSIDTDNETGLATLTLESDETLQEWDHVAPGLAYTVPPSAVDLEQIWKGAQLLCQPLYTLALTSLARVSEEHWRDVQALILQEGTRFTDWLWTLAETAGVWVHSDQRSTSQGGLLAEARESAHTWGLDLSDTAAYPLVTRRRRILTSEEAASHLDLTVEWAENGQQQTLTRRYTNPHAKTRRLATRTLKTRPPLNGLTRRLPDNWLPALTLLERLSERTWTETLEARSCYWLRPRDPVTLNDKTPALIASITFDGDTGLMTIQARPY